MAYKQGIEGIDNLYQTNVSVMPYVYNPAYASPRMPAQMGARYPNGNTQEAQQNVKRIGVMNSQVFDSKVYQNSEMPYDPNCIPNPYNPYGFSNQQPAFQYTNVHQLKRDAANSGQYQVVDNLSKKPHAQQPSQVVYLPQINSFPYGAPLYQNLPAVYPPGTRSYPSYIPGKAETGKSPCWPHDGSLGFFKPRADRCPDSLQHASIEAERAFFFFF